MIEIVAGELEAGAEGIERAEHLQALFGAFGDRLVGGGGQIGIGAGLGAADAAADLVELGEAEAIGAVDDQRVGAGDVEPGFDDGGGEQHVIALVVEGAHAFFDFAGGHLAVRGDGFDLGDFGADEFLDIGQVGDAGDDEEALAAAIVFAQQGLAQDDLVAGHDIGAHREAIDRRGRDDRQFAQAGQRHLQRARDRGGGEGEDVDVGLQRLQPFLVGDAEALFLVDDDEAEALELDRFGEDGVGADDDVDRAVGEAFAGGLGVVGGDEAARAGGPGWEGRRSVRRNWRNAGGRGGWSGRRRRPACPDRAATIGGAEGDFGLAEADVAADEAVHRLAAGEIGEDIVDGAVLIVGFHIGEFVGEGGVAVRRRHGRVRLRAGRVRRRS